MTLISQMLRVSEAFCHARGLSASRVSTLVFNDGKRLALLAAGGDLTTSTFERAMAWLSDNWPDGAEWPADVPRPDHMTVCGEPAAHHETVEGGVA